jgi:hypothetical protein
MCGLRNLRKGMIVTPVFKLALSQSPGWVVAAKEIEGQLLPLPALKPGNVWLAFIYATDHLAQDLSSILT